MRCASRDSHSFVMYSELKAIEVKYSALKLYTYVGFISGRQNETGGNLKKHTVYSPNYYSYYTALSFDLTLGKKPYTYTRLIKKGKRNGKVRFSIYVYFVLILPLRLTFSFFFSFSPFSSFSTSATYIFSWLACNLSLTQQQQQQLYSAGEERYPITIATSLTAT